MLSGWQIDVLLSLGVLGSGGLCVARAEPFTISYFNTIVPSIVDNPQVLYRLFSMSFKAEKDHIVYFSIFFILYTEYTPEEFWD